MDEVYDTTTTSGTPQEHVIKLRETIETLQNRAKDNIRRYWEASKRYFDRNRKDFHLETGQKVLVRLTDAERQKFESVKLAPRWSSPCTIVAEHSNGVTYKVLTDQNQVKVVHISRLIPLMKSWTIKGTDEEKSETSSPPTEGGIPTEEIEDEFIMYSPVTPQHRHISLPNVSPSPITLCKEPATSTPSTPTTINRPQATEEASQPMLQDDEEVAKPIPSRRVYISDNSASSESRSRKSDRTYSASEVSEPASSRPRLRPKQQEELRQEADVLREAEGYFNLCKPERRPINHANRHGRGHKPSC